MIVSSRGADHWTFTTVTSPRDGLHPVSGNCAFGYAENGDGSVTFYTRGIDRITDDGMRLANWVSDRFDGSSGDGIAFNGADRLWASFQNGLVDYVEQTGGSARTEAPIVARPNWNELAHVILGRQSVEAYYDSVRR